MQTNCQELLAKIAQFRSDELFDEALSCIEELETSFVLTSDLAILKGRMIQLAKSESYNLEDSEALFESVLERNPSNVEALMELGWLYLNVYDNAEAGRGYFQRAKDACCDHLEKAALGEAKCIVELDSFEAAESFLQDLGYPSTQII